MKRSTKVGVLILIAAVQMLLRGWAVSLCWRWFLMPLGAPAIGIAHAYGLTIVGSLLASTLVYKPQNRESPSVEDCVGSLIYTLIAVGGAYLVHLAAHT